jgi:uncharacterized membrane protein YeaQ/YmgE (transglycosylase-associated protein family)
MLTGGLIGWVGYVFLGANEGRGLQVSIVLGSAGALIGGELMPPALGGAPSGFSAHALLFAGAVATAFLALGNLVPARWRD